jgi:hypothetical protein
MTAVKSLSREGVKKAASSTILKIISHMAKRGQVLVCVVVRRPVYYRYNSS